MTSVGFGNVAAETDNEKIFSILMMVVSGKLLVGCNLVPLDNAKTKRLENDFPFLFKFNFILIQFFSLTLTSQKKTATARQSRNF